VVVEDATTDPLVTRATIAEGIRSMVAVPLAAGDDVRGLLAVIARRPSAFSADDINFVSAAGALLAAAVERRSALRSRPEGAGSEHRLLEAAETVNRSLDSAALETTILAEATRLLNAHKAALFLVRGDVLVAQDVHGLSERYREMSVVPLEGSAWGRAVVGGQTIAVDDVYAEGGPASALAEEGAYRSFVVAPLESYSETIGALSVFSEHERRFGDYEMTLLRTFAIQASIALDNRRLMREKDQMAVRDGLTGVYNRSYLELTLERTRKELSRHGGSVSVLFFDLDGMKAVNDTHGHQAGDRLLREMATLLVRCCRETDVVARYGGDEFVVLMPRTDEQGAGKVAEKVQDAIARHNEEAAPAVQLSASMGLHAVSSDDIDDLLRVADRRMYEMKEARQGRPPGRAET
jgi:diguanylate cyclase (GGDEF)-like protein